MKLKTQQKCPKCDGRGTLEIVHGPALRQIRAEVGLSLREVARRLNFSAAYISDIEHGRRACTETIECFYRRLK